MSDGIERRDILKLAAGIAASGMAVGAARGAPPGPNGEIGDFDFLTGEWKIAHRYRENGNWLEFGGEATVIAMLGGLVSVEELRIPVRDFFGVGLRVLDLKEKLWADHWMNAKTGVLGAPGVTGYFVDGVGAFISDDVDADGKPIKVRGVWDEITGNSHRWRQGVSTDGGAIWDDSWIMHWTRA